jgi:signal peptide peptidase SppA
MNILNEIIRGVWLMEPGYAKLHFPRMLKVLLGETDDMPAMFSDNPASADGFKFAIRDENTIKQFNPFSGSSANIYDVFYDPDSIKDDTIFIMDISGPITKYMSWYSWGMKVQAEWLKLADAHPSIRAHVLCIDSGGGEGYACNYMKGVIKSLKKPVYSYVEGYAASAAYWIASAGRRIGVSTPMDRLGSIGTYVTVADVDKFYKRMGIILKDIYATKSKDKNQDYLQAIKGNETLMQEVVDEYNEHFLKHVAESRGDKLKGGEKEWGTGKFYFAQDAINLGLADEIISIERFINSIFDELIP